MLKQLKKTQNIKNISETKTAKIEINRKNINFIKKIIEITNQYNKI